MSLKANDRKKLKTKALGTYKLTRKPCLIYLEVKLQQDMCG